MHANIAKNNIKMTQNRIIAQIPNALTILNLFFGCISIVYALEGELRMAAIMMLLAFHADIFDGMSARLLKVQSSIGKELDSLADLVSFGLAPAVVMHMMMRDTLAVDHFSFQMSPKEWIFLLIPFLLTIFSALRLAKFNVDENQTNKFIGLPTPANALMVLSLPLIAYKQPDSFVLDIFSNPIGVIAYSFIVSFLMIAPIELYGLKLKGFKWQENKFRYLFLALGLLTVIIFYHTGLFLTIVLYFFYGTILAVLKRKGLIS